MAATLTEPLIKAGCIVQLYGKLPLLVKVYEKDPLLFDPEFHVSAPGGGGTLVLVWVPLAQFHCTVSPTLMETVDGVKLKLATDTLVVIAPPAERQRPTARQLKLARPDCNKHFVIIIDYPFLNHCEGRAHDLFPEKDWPIWSAESRRSSRRRKSAATAKPRTSVRANIIVKGPSELRVF